MAKQTRVPTNPATVLAKEEKAARENQIIKTLKCAMLDLKGAQEHFEAGTYADHDWEAHALSIEECEDLITELERK